MSNYDARRGMFVYLFLNWILFVYRWRRQLYDVVNGDVWLVPYLRAQRLHEHYFDGVYVIAKGKPIWKMNLVN